MKFRATILAILLISFSATSGGLAVATPCVVDKYTEQPSNPGGGCSRPGSGASPDGGGNNSGGSGSAGQTPPPTGPVPESFEAPGQPGGTGGIDATGRVSNSKVKPNGKKPSSGGKKARNVGTEPDMLVQEEAASPVVAESSSLGVGFPFILLVVSAAIVAIAIGRRRDATRRQV
jgi:hypothetical protein